MSDENFDSGNNEAIEKERAELAEINKRSYFGRLGGYTKKCGPGWLQGAITLGGGSLAGALYLGVIGGTNFMWIQPLAMVLGIIMLSAIAYVTLSTGKRPFRAINEHVSPVLGWGWIIATIAANIIWCLPQFNLAFGAVSKNLIPSVGEADSSKYIVSGVILAITLMIVWSYGSGSKGVKFFESFLKIMVAFIVLSFVGVIIMLSVSKDSTLSWAEVLAGFVPDFGSLFRPSDSFAPLIEASSDPVGKAKEVVAKQREVIMAAFATAVGINMTFLLPYSMLKKGWGKEHRGLAIFDLSTGLFIPFFIATGCLVIAAASQFHATNLNLDKDPVVMEAAIAANEDTDLAELKGSDEEAYDKILNDALASLETKQQADIKIDLMLEKRSQWDLAAALEPFTGKTASQYVFGLGVLAMAISTIIILMLINGFAFCELANVAPGGNTFRIGTLVAGTAGFFGPILWGKMGAYLAIPTSVIGLMLLPIAYFAFFFLMNSKDLMGDNMPKGGRRFCWNSLMLVAAFVALFGAGWAVKDKMAANADKLGMTKDVAGWVGIGIFVVIGLLVLITFKGKKSKG